MLWMYQPDNTVHWRAREGGIFPSEWWILISLRLALMSKRLTVCYMENLPNCAFLTHSTMFLRCSAHVRVSRNWTHFIAYQEGWVFCGEQRAFSTLAKECWQCDCHKQDLWPCRSAIPPTYPSYQCCLCPQYLNCAKLWLVARTRLSYRVTMCYLSEEWLCTIALLQWKGTELLKRTENILRYRKACRNQEICFVLKSILYYMQEDTIFRAAKFTKKTRQTLSVGPLVYSPAVRLGKMLRLVI